MSHTKGSCEPSEGACSGADRWIDFVLFDVAHVDRPADEAAQPGVQRERTQTLEPIRGRDRAVASSNALWTRCADGVLSLAPRV